jgi:hypothetical protein
MATAQRRQMTSDGDSRSGFDARLAGIMILIIGVVLLLTGET